MAFPGRAGGDRGKCPRPPAHPLVTCYCWTRALRILHNTAKSTA
jgi:hypothetical protein